MKWVTREGVKVDRVACPWLIRRFVDPEAEFIFVPAGEVVQVAEREGAIPFDVTGVELGHYGPHCSFEAVMDKYELVDPALVLLAQIVNGADADQATFARPEAPGLKAIAEGFRHLGLADDHEIVAHESVVYDALYAYCRTLTRAAG